MKQECIPVGCVPSAAVAAGGGRGVSQHALDRGVSAWGVSVREGGVGVSTLGGVAARGVCISQHALGGGGCLLQCMLGYFPPWTEFLTHTCENITFPQLRCGR